MPTVTPANVPKKPNTRSNSKNNPNASSSPVTDLSGSPILRGRKRRKSTTEEQNEEEPAAKKMAEDKILDAIKAVNTSVTAMENRMKSFSTKADLNNMVCEIKDVKEKVMVNSLNIEKLFDLRRDDQKELHKKMEEIIETKLTNAPSAQPTTAASNMQAEREMQYLLARRSVRIWPISEVNELERSVRTFFKRYLKIPPTVADNIDIELAKRQEQPRRSKTVHKEVLVRFSTSQSRDVVQSYAVNLSEAKGAAGLRLEIPDFLRGLFRRFESHGAALRSRYGVVKRSIRFDDERMSLSMDVKLENTQWHRLTATDMDSIPTGTADNGMASRAHVAEKKRILMTGDGAEGERDETFGRPRDE